MPDITYPTGGGGAWPAHKPEAKAEPTAVIALCDGSTLAIHGKLDEAAIAEANAAAYLKLCDMIAMMMEVKLRDLGEALVERIAKRVVEMQKPKHSYILGGGIVIRDDAASPYVDAIKAEIAKSEERVKADFERNFG